jgi:hypothetical protein
MSKTILAFLFLIPFCSFSQNVFIKRDNKLTGFDQLKRIKIYQYKKSGNSDSVNIITEVDSLYKTGDTLVVRPWIVEERFLKDTTLEVSVQKIYKASSKTLLKIPVNEVDVVVAKKRSISKVFSIASTAAFIAVAASIPLRLGNSDNRTIGNAIFVTAAPILIVSWTLQATIAKKKYHFDKSRTDKAVWIFN